MPGMKLIADSGSTKAEWSLTGRSTKKKIFTQGISPYFLGTNEIVKLLREELLPEIKGKKIDEVFYYGTGCSNPVNANIVKKAILEILPDAEVKVEHDLTAAARALCGHEKGIACILGTGSNSCYYNGKRIVLNSPGLGYVLGDEGSGAYLGKKVIQYYLYGIFDEKLNAAFEKKYKTDSVDILDHVYKQPLPNRYLAGFTMFLSENRGHFMIENIIEDGLNDFFFIHLRRYKESRTLPVHFVGGVAHGFKDVLIELCRRYEFKPGKILKNPMEGLIEYHR
jgi:glucosamine kinase